MRHLEQRTEPPAASVVESGILDLEIELSWCAPPTSHGRSHLPADRPVLLAGELVILEECHGLHCEYFLG